MKKRRLKKKPIIILCSVVICFFVIILSINLVKHYTSFEYKLGKVGYSEDEIQSILKLDKKYINYAFYSSNVDEFLA